MDDREEHGPDFAIIVHLWCEFKFGYSEDTCDDTMVLLLYECLFYGSPNLRISLVKQCQI